MTLLATAHMKVVQVKSDCLIWIWHAETGTSCVPWTIHDGSHHLWIMLCFWWSADWMISNSRWTISETWYFVADVDVCSCLSSIPSLYIISDFGVPQKRFWRKNQPKNYIYQTSWTFHHSWRLFLKENCWALYLGMGIFICLEWSWMSSDVGSGIPCMNKHLGWCDSKVAFDRHESLIWKVASCRFPNCISC